MFLLGGGAAAYWVYSQKFSSPSTLPAGVAAIPQDALLTVTLTTDESQWNKLREFGTAKTQADLDKTLVELRDNLLTENGYDYEKDIKPWVGKEVTIALLTPESKDASQPSKTPGKNFQDSPSPDQQPAVVVLPIARPGQAQKILANPKPLKSGKWTDRTYQGFSIRETEGASPQNYSATVLGKDFLVLSNHPKAMNLALDSYKQKTSIANNPGYAKAMEQIKTDRPFGLLYVNVPVAADLAASNPKRPLSPENLAQLKQNQGFAAAMAVEPEGLRLRGISWLNPDSERKHTGKNDAQNMTSRLPAETLAMFAGSDLQNLWQQYAQGSVSGQALPGNPNRLLEGFKSATNLDLEQDFLAWMKGEFSLALLPPAPDAKSNFPVGLVFMVEAKDRNAAEKSLSQLDKVMGERYPLKVDNTTLANQPVTTWSIRFGGPLVTRGWINGNVAFLTLGAPVASTILPKPATTLEASEIFQKAIPTELKASNSRLFIDIDRTVRTFNATNLPIGKILPTSEETLGAIKTIGLTTNISSDRVIRYDLLVALNKAGPPKPLPAPQP